ncbi:MAG: hypothetical protein ACR2RA_19885 [Geminicoccaceae bacterium]
MAERLSDWQRFKLWIEDLKIAYALNKLRRIGELQRILDESPYTYLRPGSSLGDDWYHVHPKDSNQMDAIVHSSLRENRALWWIVEHHRRNIGA